MIVQGQMFRNGHGQCGGCGYLVSPIEGGRQKRKAQGWRYTGRHVIGWVCDVCARWALEGIRESPLAPGRTLTERPPLESPVRGFGPKRAGELLQVDELVKRGHRLRKKRARLARRKANRAAGLPSGYVETATMSSTEYRRWKRRL